jgi:DNA-binding CsgD family transcriptional regulator
MFDAISHVHYEVNSVLNTQVKEIAIIFIFVIVTLASGVDFLTDLSHGATIGHVTKEAIIVGISVLAILWLLLGVRQQAVEIATLKQELNEAINSQNHPKEYILEMREKLSTVITQQFSEWKLTSSEAEVGWLLLKGLSLKEISIVRNTLDKTVRQQASSIYKKAGLTGRHTFSAWFIEDIL